MRTVGGGVILMYWLSRSSPTEWQLGKLVQFQSRKTERAEGRHEPVQSAEILIFTGIRYEREAPATPTKPTSTPRSKRKRG